uniref:Nucleolar phosphoprotein n=1 Tax=Pararge aegeria TaxID=116150 RepID=S4PI00_9NEOP
MEESVALDSSQQKKFVKSVKGIKKLLKKSDKTPGDPKPEVVNEKRNKVKKGRKAIRRKSRGLVYLSHIPHGFYEQQMTEYFKQFGVVTNARVIRSRRTGNSKGFAFVEFREPAVAEIVAETMNNYLMGKRLIKAVYISPNKQKVHALRKKWNTLKNPSSDERLMFRKLHNADKNEAQELKIARKLLSNLSKTKQKLSNLGIDYDFFKPVDVPEALIDKVDDVIAQTDKKEVKNESNEFKSNDTLKAAVKTEPEDTNGNLKTKKTKKKQLKQNQTEKSNKANPNEAFIKKANLKIEKGKLEDKNKPTEKDENNQIKKTNIMEKKLKKKAGVPENFINIKESVDSDSSIDFDSDEFEKMIEEENNDDLSSNENSEPEDEKIKKIIKIQPKQNAKGAQNKGKAKPYLQAPKKQDKENANVKSQSLVKRSNPENAPVTTKKAKFGKQISKKPLNKVIKRRK